MRYRRHPNRSIDRMLLRHVTIGKFCSMSGYTEDAVRSKIKRGDWLEGKVWRYAPDGRVLIDLGGYEAWVTGQSGMESGRLLGEASKSTSIFGAYAAANG